MTTSPGLPYTKLNPYPQFSIMLKMFSHTTSVSTRIRTHWYFFELLININLLERPCVTCLYSSDTDYNHSRDDPEEHELELPTGFAVVINGHSLVHALHPQLELLFLEVSSQCKFFVIYFCIQDFILLCKLLFM